MNIPHHPKILYIAFPDRPSELYLCIEQDITTTYIIGVLRLVQQSIYHIFELLFIQKVCCRNTQFNLFGNTPAITADKIHLINIIDNLLENAVKYSREDVHIEIDYQEQNNDSIRISVRDNGLGISKPDSRHVFEKFYRGRAVIDKGIPGMKAGSTQ